MSTPLSTVREPATDAAPTGAAGPGAGSRKPGLDVFGGAALVATVCLWSAFALSDRALASSTLRPADAALIRFGLPVALLAPALWKRRRQYAAMRPGPAIKIILGGGVPFYLAVTYGGSLTSAAFVGALVPGMVPLFAALLAALGGSTPKRVQTAGLGLISLGVAALVAPEVAAVDERTLTGAGLLLLASGLWALYTAGLRETNLDAVASMGLLCAPTFVGVALLILTGLLPSTLAHAAPHDVLVFALVQGIGTGVCSGLLYAVAVRRLGSSRCTTVGSLSPVLTAAAAVPLLGETLTVVVTAGTALIAAGVVLANRTGAPKTRRRPAGHR
ncbi:DMT family transporter [Nonomuraea rhodomycinica]|uniref:DMT family transporter n=1 Tax=Nonomuraea rhodomycinica TaxID=1712872 RepID=A0A7Y6IJI6_9ACTN|nr:DMT family transporter [Nonomuraea rhodomycinica]NUW39341.1 DMT family transporter [Nonomuraea rhodomycinica]